MEPEGDRWSLMINGPRECERRVHERERERERERESV